MAEENEPSINPEEFTLPFDDAGKLQLFKLLIQGLQDVNKKVERLSAENVKLRTRVNVLEDAVVEQSEMLCLHDNRTRAAVVVKECKRKPRLYQKVDDGIELVK